MSRPRHLLFVFAFIVAMSPLVAPLAPAASAQNPNKPIVVQVDDTFPAPNLTNRCGFAVTANVAGTFTFMLHPSGIELAHIRYQHTFSGPGGSVTVKRAENIKYSATISPDGTLVETLTLTGSLMYHNVVPGYGSIGNNSGREILQVTWVFDEVLEDYVVTESILFDAGPNNELTDAEFAVICEQLG